MVHNGIEYGDMQLICEAYNLMKDVLGRLPVYICQSRGKRSNEIRGIPGQQGVTEGIRWVFSQ